MYIWCLELLESRSDDSARLRPSPGAGGPSPPPSGVVLRPLFNTLDSPETRGSIMNIGSCVFYLYAVSWGD